MTLEMMFGNEAALIHWLLGVSAMFVCVCTRPSYAEDAVTCEQAAQKGPRECFIILQEGSFNREAHTK